MDQVKPQELGVVIFFERNEKGTFNTVGQTQPMKYFYALDVYANTPNPASQIVGGDTVEEVNTAVSDMIKKMLDPEYVKEYVDDYL